jgi:uncharacterized protein (TIRG00374 family)
MEGGPAKHKRRILFAIARVGLGFGLIAYLAESGFIKLRDLSHLITAWPLTLAALALLLLNVGLVSWRLSLLFRPQGLRLPLRTALRLTLVGLFFDIFLPGAAGGMVAKLFYATRENEGRRTEVATVIVFDRIMGIFSLLLLPLIFAPFFSELIVRVHVLRLIVIIYIAVCSFLLVLFLACLWGQSTMTRLAGAIHFSRLRKVMARALEVIGTYRHRPVPLLYALGLSLAANLSIVGVITVALLVVDPRSVAWRLCLIVPIGQIVNSLPLTPGGLGVGEVAFNTLFRVSALGGGAEAMLCWRIWGALVGGIGLFFYARGMKHCIITVEAPPQVALPQAGTTQRSAGGNGWSAGRGFDLP